MSQPAPDGILLVDKAVGVTSHDVVDIARRALGTRRVGHAGTLDPFATGLLVLLVGRATRLAQFVDGEPKVYDTTIRFGAETDSDDATGAVTREAGLPDPAAVRAALPQLTGDLSQVPPSVSAKQVGGVRAHSAARRGAPLDLAPARVTVHAWDVHAIAADELRATIACSGGTYVRALARDLGRAAGSAAHCAALRRIRSGVFHVRDAVPLGELGDRGADAVRSMLDGLGPIARESLDADGVRRITHGMPAPATVAGARGALVDADGTLVAIAERDGDDWRPRVVLRDA